jgi:hypothetical protein
VRTGRVEPPELLRLFAEIEPWLYRYPAIDPATFRRAVEEFVGNICQSFLNIARHQR